MGRIRTDRTGASRGSRTTVAVGVVVIGVVLGLLEAGSAGAAPQASPTLQQKAQGIDIAVHRGLRGAYRGRIADEDSVRSCLSAVNAGADACEIDVRITGNGVPVLMHDANTRRVTRGGKRCNLVVARKTYQQLKQCRLNHGDLIPRLTDLGAAMRPYAARKSLVVELKGGVFTGSALAKVNRYLRIYGFTGARGNLIYESYNRTNLRSMKRIAAAVPGYLISDGAPSAAGVDAVGGLDGLILPLGSLVRAVAADPDYVTGFSAAGLRVMPWLVNSPTAMRWVIDQGAHGFMTDNVATLRAAIGLRRSGG